MLKRVAPWGTILILIVSLAWAALSPAAGSQVPATPVEATDPCVGPAADVPDACQPPEPTSTPPPEPTSTPPAATGEVDAAPTEIDADDGGTPEDDQRDTDRDGDGTADGIDTCPDTADPEQPDADGDGTGDACDTDTIASTTEVAGTAADTSEPPVQVASASETPVQAADPTAIEVYCEIPNAAMPDQRIVGTFVNARTGFGDPTVTFTLYDLNGNAITGNGPPPVTGSPPLPASNPITATPPSNWEWGPGGYSRLTVSATYPSLDPAVEDFTTSLTISCVPDAPTPTPPPPPTPDPSITPAPTPTPAGYTPQFATEMRDTAGNIIPDGATVAPGTGIVDVATISGLPPGTTGTVIYQLFRDNCSVFLGNVGFGVSVVADANGVAVAPGSAVFTAPGFPGGFYDWRIVYTDANVGFVYSGCGPETFFVPPPPPSQGTGNARLTCFLREPPEPGRAGYKVNISPLPATGTVEVNVTLQLDPGSNIYEYKTVTLPPGTLQDLEFYGAYTYAWVTVIFRDDTGETYAAVRLEGECAATPGPTPTPSPTFTPTATATVTPTATLTPTPTNTSTSTPTLTLTSTPTSTSTPSPTGTGSSTIAPTATTQPGTSTTLPGTNTPIPSTTATTVPATGTAGSTPASTTPPHTATSTATTRPTQPATGTAQATTATSAVTTAPARTPTAPATTETGTISTSTGTTRATATGTTRATATGTATATATPTTPVSHLPDTGAGVGGDGPMRAVLLVVAAVVLAGCATILARGAAPMRE